MRTHDRISRRLFLRRGAAAAQVIPAIVAGPHLRDVLAQNGDYELVCAYDGVRVRALPSLSGTIGNTIPARGAVLSAGPPLVVPAHGGTLQSWMAIRNGLST